MADRKLTQTEILKQLRIPTTKQELLDIEGNGRLQQSINTQATLHGLPEPFAPSAASAVIQDLIPVAAIGAAAALPADAAAGEAAAATSATAGTGAGYGLKSLSNLATLAKAGGIAALLVDPSFLWRMVKIVGGLALAYIGVRQLAGAGGIR